ncbi:MAG: hypothetical protein K8H84_07820 [Sulfuricella denitrificans]|nr:hypothetical protein [Sulfuricella denitrificans]
MKTNDILIVGAVAVAAYMMLKGNTATAGTRTVTMATPGAGTVGGFNPLTSIADYLARMGTVSGGGGGWNPFDTTAAQTSSWWTGVSTGMIPDANSASVLPGAMDYGMSYDPSTIAGTVAGW